MARFKVLRKVQVVRKGTPFTLPPDRIYIDWDWVCPVRRCSGMVFSDPADFDASGTCSVCGGSFTLKHLLKLGGYNAR